MQPQMWTYERTVEGGRAPYRAFVSIPGHLYENFNRPNYRAILLRGIAWAGQRANADELLKQDRARRQPALRRRRADPPAKAAAKIEVHPDFNLTLVAAEPLIKKAMNIDWDERGRLWVSETPEYPNGRKRAEYRALERERVAPPAAGPRPGGHHLDPVGHERRRRDGPQARVRRQAGARHRFRVPPDGRHRGDLPGHLVSRRHQRRPGRRQAHEAVHRASAPPTRMPSSTTFAGGSTAGFTPRTATASGR